MADYELIDGKEEHLDGIIRLWSEVYDSPLNENHMRWRYFKNPVGSTPISLAYDRQNKSVVGFYSAIPVQMQLGRDSVLGGQVIDSMVHPDFQGKGVFGNMATHCYQAMADQDYAVLYGFPNQNAYRGCVNRLNFHHMGAIPVFVRPLRPLTGLLSPLNTMVKLWPRKNASASVVNDLPEATVLDHLLRETEQVSRLCRVARNAEWMFWRYHPKNIRHFRQDSSRAYHWECLYGDEGQLRAVCVWGILDQGPDASLCELHGLDEEGVAIVLGNAIATAEKKGLRIFRSYTKHDALRKHIKKQGFIALPERFGMPFIVRSLTPLTPGGNIHRHACWQITGGDTDTQ
jgi:hypothetical protein